MKEAVQGDGKILFLRRYGAEMIQTNGKSLTPDEDPRTIARWVGGMEDLQRRRYIQSRGHKGEIFDVTREGYQAADALK